jgi:hypothetical protein
MGVRASVSNLCSLSRSLAGSCKGKLDKVQISFLCRKISRPLPCTLVPQLHHLRCTRITNCKKLRPVLCVQIDDRHMPNRNNGAASRQQQRDNNYNWCHSRRCHGTTAYNSRCTCLWETVKIALHVMIGSVCQRMDQFFAASRTLALPCQGATSGEQPAP